MPRPLAPGTLRPRERQCLEEELAELPVQAAGYLWELALMPTEDKTRWEFLEWQIQHAQQRLATIEMWRGHRRGSEPAGTDSMP